MDWVAILEMLLPLLLQLLEDSPEDLAVAQMKRRGLFFRLRVGNFLRQEVAQRLYDEIEKRVAEMSEEQLLELCKMAKAQKEGKSNI